MSKQTKILLYIAAFFTLATCLGHTAGTFMEIPADQIEVRGGYEAMKHVYVPMPVGSPRSFATLFDGNSIGLSVWLLIAGLMFIAFARNPKPDRWLLILNTAGMGGLAVVSLLYFFPVPVIFLAIATVAGGMAAKRV